MCSEIVFAIPKPSEVANFSWWYFSELFCTFSPILVKHCAAFSFPPCYAKEPWEPYLRCTKVIQTPQGNDWSQARRCNEDLDDRGSLLLCLRLPVAACKSSFATAKLWCCDGGRNCLPKHLSSQAFAQVQRNSLGCGSPIRAFHFVNCTSDLFRSTECTKIAHRRSLAIFTADEGIARNSAARIIFTCFHRRRNRGSLAIFPLQRKSRILGSQKVAWLFRER